MLLLCIVVITGCSKSKQSYTYSLPIDDVYLGIQYEELSRVIDIKNTELLKSEIGHYNYLTVNNQKILNENASVIYSFFDYDTGALKNKLFRVSIEFDYMDAEVFLSKLENMYGEYTYYPNETSKLYVWHKEALSTLSNERIDKMKQIEISGYSDITDIQLEYVDHAYQSAENTPISSIRFISRSNPTDDQSAYSLSIEGKYAVLNDLAKGRRYKD